MNGWFFEQRYVNPRDAGGIGFIREFIGSDKLTTRSGQVSSESDR